MMKIVSPKLSVVIPCYGVEAYLDRCVESVLAQGMRDMEIILVDDGSPDCVPEMCDEWAQKDSRIKVIHKKNAGLGMACNSGLDLATGKYVAFLDSDDWVDPEMYHTMLEAAEKYQTQMVFTGLKRVDEIGKETGRLAHKEQLLIAESKVELNSLACDMIASEASVATERTIQMSAKVVLYDRKTIEDHKIRFISEREIMSEDLHFNLNILAHSKCACVLPKFFYNYRCNSDSITHSLDLDKFEKIKKLYDYTLCECEDLDINKKYRERTQRLFIGYTRDYLRSLVRSELPFKQKQSLLKTIINDSIWESILSDYPISISPLKHRLYLHFLQKKKVTAIYILLKYK